MYEIANWNTHFCFRKTHHGILWTSSRFSLVSHTYFSGYYVIWCETKNKFLFEFVICEGACETQRRLQRGRPDFAPAGSCSLPPRGHAARARMHAAALLRSFPARWHDVSDWVPARPWKHGYSEKLLAISLPLSVKIWEFSKLQRNFRLRIWFEKIDVKMETLERK